MERKNKILSLLAVIAGNVLYALTVAVFLLPTGLITGGTTGIALAFNVITGFDISIFVFIFNLLMLILGYFCLGKKFAMTTVLSSFVYPVALGIFQKMLGTFVLTDDIFLCTIFTGLGIGLSLGIVIRTGASTGGMDIPPLVLQKYFHIPVSITMYLFDFGILLLQSWYNQAENVLYGIILVIIYTLVLDKVLIIGTDRIQVKIVSEKHELIRQAILTKLDRGVTMLEGNTGYLNKETQIVLTVISNRELHTIESLIYTIDPEAFTIISKISEVRGRGFTLVKRYK